MLNDEFFALIEKSGSAGITAQEIADHTGCNLQAVRNWVSRWKTKGYLKLIPHEGHIHDPNRRQVESKFTAGRPKGSAGRYILGDKWWGELVYSREDVQ